MIVEMTLRHLLRGGDDGVGAVFVEALQFAIDLGGDALDQGQRMNEIARHELPADAEVAASPLGLRAPITVGGNLDGTKTVGLHAHVRRGWLGHRGHPLSRELNRSRCVRTFAP